MTFIIKSYLLYFCIAFNGNLGLWNMEYLLFLYFHFVLMCTVIICSYSKSCSFYFVILSHHEHWFIRNNQTLDIFLNVKIQKEKIFGSSLEDTWLHTFGNFPVIFEVHDNTIRYGFIYQCSH